MMVIVNEKIKLRQKSRAKKICKIMLLVRGIMVKTLIIMIIIINNNNDDNNKNNIN